VPQEIPCINGKYDEPASHFDPAPLPDSDYQTDHHIHAGEFAQEQRQCPGDEAQPVEARAIGDHRKQDQRACRDVGKQYRVGAAQVGQRDEERQQAEAGKQRAGAVADQPIGQQGGDNRKADAERQPPLQRRQRRQQPGIERGAPVEHRQRAVAAFEQRSMRGFIIPRPAPHRLDDAPVGREIADRAGRFRRPDTRWRDGGPEQCKPREPQHEQRRRREHGDNDGTARVAQPGLGQHQTDGLRAGRYSRHGALTEHAERRGLATAPHSVHC